MAAYPNLAGLMPRGSGPASAAWGGVVAHLINVWIADYDSEGAELVEVSSNRFSYLFDTAAGRLIAAWGVSQGRHGGDRDRRRSAGHPLSAGPLYHRGHAISHRLGGALDINLVPQLGKVNTGPFRRLENDAVATPGAFYFTYWKYPAGLTAKGFPSQVPTGVDQGLLVPGQSPRIIAHAN